MAESTLPENKYGPWWVWLGGAFISVWIIIFFTLKSDSSKNIATLQNGKLQDSLNSSKTVLAKLPDWNNVNTQGARIYYDEISDTSVNVVDKLDYTTYTLKENIVFASEKSDVLTSAVDRLVQIKNSLKKHYRDANIGIYGNTNSTDSTGYNKELSNRRAEAVKSWFRNNGIIQDYISIHTLDDQDASTADVPTLQKVQNHNIVIVVFRDKSQDIIYKQ